jgi:hypothetical protein
MQEPYRLIVVLQPSGSWLKLDGPWNPIKTEKEALRLAKGFLTNSFGAGATVQVWQGARMLHILRWAIVTEQAP